MKRLMAVLLAVLMIFAFCSCGGSGNNATNDDTRRVDNADESLILINDYEIKYLGHEIIIDEYDGGEVLVIDWNFTNNSDEATSFFLASLYEAEQNGQAIYTATIFPDEDSTEALDDSLMVEVEPGQSLDVKQTYGLIDSVNPVTITFTDLFSNQTDVITIDLEKTEPEQSAQEDDDTANVEEVIGLSGNQWYGWWMVSEATGEFEEFDGVYYDCCVNFEPTNEGYTLVSIWDEEFTDYVENCIGEIYFEYYDELGYSSVGGYFLTGDDIASEGQVMVMPDTSEVEHTLFVTIPVKAEDGGFTAALFLTEWGYEWDEDFGDYPTYYDSYFLPLMQEGKALPENLDDIG